MSKFLVKRGNIWWFKRDVPKPLQPIVGRTAWTKSLKVHTLPEARRLQPQYAAWTYAEEAEAAAKLKAGWTPPLPRSGGSGMSPGEMEALDLAAEASAAAEAAAMAPETVFAERFAAEVEELRTSIGKPLFALSPENAAVALLVQEAREQVRREQYDEGARYFAKSEELAAQLRAPADKSPPKRAKVAPGDRTVNDLLDAYEAAKRAGINGKRGWSESSKSAFAPVRRVLSGVLGKRTIHSVTREDARKLQELIVQLPKNLGKQKKLAGLPIEQTIKRVEALGLPKIEAKTVNGGYLVHIVAVFNWAVKEEWAVKNPG